MSAESYDVLLGDVQNMQNDYTTIRGEIGEKLDVLATDMDGIVGMASFSGTAALKAKGYFSEVHQGYLMPAFQALMGQLATDYALYYQRFVNDPLYETTDNARWPDSGMKDYIQKLTSQRDSSLTSAESELISASNILAGLGGYSLPTTDATRAQLESEISATQKTVDGVAGTETYGAQLFGGAGGEFDNLLSALSAAIAACENGVVGLGSYHTGAFSAVVGSTGLRDAYNASVANQTQNSDVTVRSQQDSITKAQTRIEREAREAAEEKAKWNVLGTIGSILVIAGAVVGTVATCGAGTPALVSALAIVGGAATVANETSNIIGRSKENSSIRSGNYYTEGNEFFAEGMGERGQEFVDDIQDTQGKLKDAGEVLGEGIKSEHFKADNFHYRASEADYNMFRKGGSIAIDAGFEFFEDNVAKTDEGKLATKITKEVVSQGYDRVTDIGYGPKGPSGIIGATGKVISAVADYNCDQCDERLQNLSEEAGDAARAQSYVGAYDGQYW